MEHPRKKRPVRRLLLASWLFHYGGAGFYILFIMDSRPTKLDDVNTTCLHFCIHTTYLSLTPLFDIIELREREAIPLGTSLAFP